MPPLVDGGVMLTFQCSSACRHCLYRCSQNAGGKWMAPETAREVFAALADEPRLRSIHLAGGEAALNMDALVETISICREAGVAISYLETNGSWCVSPEVARGKFARMADAGLPAVLVSASPFHNEFIPFERTRMAVESAIEVFGRAGVIVWTGEMYHLLSQLPPQRTHALDEFLAWAGLDEEPDTLRSMYPLTPGGRVTEELRRCFQPRPAGAFREARCQRDLTCVSHFHIAPGGELFAGHCPGMLIGGPGEYHRRVTPQTHPAASVVWKHGPFSLYELAAGRHGYTAKPEGYVSKCDLCLDVRKHLFAMGAHPDLGPAEFYA